MEKLLELGVEFEDITIKRKRIFSEKSKALGDFVKSNNKLPQQGEKWNGIEVGNFFHTQKKVSTTGTSKKKESEYLNPKEYI